MQVSGRRTEVHNVSVEIDPIEVIEQLFNKWKRELPDLPREADYIQDGYWHDWEDGHGSGITTKHRAATDCEERIYIGFKDMREICKMKVSK
jgi:hypothetical protein